MQKVTIDEIAAAANVSKATIYKYFQSKEALIDTVVSDIYASILKQTSVFKGDFLNALFSDTSSDPFLAFKREVKSLQ